jgi:hypothetical protein
MAFQDVVVVTFPNVTFTLISRDVIRLKAVQLRVIYLPNMPLT